MPTTAAPLVDLVDPPSIIAARQLADEARVAPHNRHRTRGRRRLWIARRGYRA